jgi:phytanoyl-CoA hydroxylase
MKKSHHERLPQFSIDAKAAIESYEQLGYHIEENLWTPAECDRLIQAAKSFPSSKDGNFAPLMQPHRESAEFLFALCNPRIVGIAEKLVKGRVAGLQSVFYFMKAGTYGFSKHQDNRFVETKPDAFASAWSALQDVTPEMGGLVGYPGSHKEPILPTVETKLSAEAGQDPNAYQAEAVLPPGYNPVDLVMSAGSVLFMHSHFVHASRQNRSRHFRYSLLLTYIRSGEPFRAGFNAKRAEVDVYRA